MRVNTLYLKDSITHFSSSHRMYPPLYLFYLVMYSDGKACKNRQLFFGLPKSEIANFFYNGRKLCIFEEGRESGAKWKTFWDAARKLRIRMGNECLLWKPETFCGLHFRLPESEIANFVWNRPLESHIWPSGQVEWIEIWQIRCEVEK